MPEAKGAVMINKGEFLDKVWTRLFRDVGLVYTPEFIRQPDWYLKHTWTEKQEQAYRDFFIRTAMEDLLLPKRLFTHGVLFRNHISDGANIFEPFSKSLLKPSKAGSAPGVEEVAGSAAVIIR
jgi:hypothetical protein